MAPIPQNKKLYKKILKEASKKFKSPSGIYRSAWIVREYLKRGGTYKTKSKPKSTSPGLRRWFREEWIDISTGKSCGRKSARSQSSHSLRYPVCRPTKRISKSTPKTVSEISKRSLRKAIREKQKVRERSNIQFGSGKFDKSKKTVAVEHPMDNPKVRSKFKKTMLERYGVENYSELRSKKKIPQKKKRIEIVEKGLESRAPTIQDINKTVASFLGPSSSKYDWLKPEEKLQDGGKAQYRGYRSKKMIPVPQKVKKWAKYFFVLKKLGFKGAIETGNKRAKQLATKDSIPIEDLRYMRNWFARHIITSYPSFQLWNEAGRPKDKEWHNKRGIQAWNSWAGNAGFRWVNSSKTIKQLNDYFGTDYTKIKANV